MATPITFNSVAYSVPAYNDTGYAQGPGNLSSYLIAIASGTLQQSGGTFSLTADVNFGLNFGLVAKYYKSITTNIATAGIVRLAKTDSIDWRNNANSNNLALAIDGSDNLTYNGAIVLTGGGSGFVSSITGTANEIIASSATGAITLSTPQPIGTGSSPTFANVTSNHTSPSSNPATAGIIRLANIDPIDWRNAANNANLPLTVDSSNNLTFNGNIISPSGAGPVTSITGTANQIIASSPTGAVTLSTPQNIGTTSSPTFGGLTITKAGSLTTLFNSTGVSSDTIQLEANGNSNFISTSSAGDFTLQGSDSTNFLSYAPGTGLLTLLGATGAIQAASNLLPNANNTLSLGTTSNRWSTIYGVNATLTNALTVPNGGTGDSSLTAYAVLCGGTTSTGAVQSVAGLGSSGQVLTSNGASALPTFQTVAGTGTVNSGTATHLAYYATSTNAVSDANGATVSGNYTFSGTQTLSGLTASTALALDGSKNIVSVTNTGSGNNVLATSPTLVTPVLGAASATSLTFSSTSGIIGTTTNNNAAAGSVGEYIESVFSAVAAPATTLYGDATSISLPAGDWDVTLNILIDQTGAGTLTNWGCAIGPNPGDDPTGFVLGSNWYAPINGFVTLSTNDCATIANYRRSFSGTTTVYGKMIATYATGTYAFSGRLSARRIR